MADVTFDDALLHPLEAHGTNGAPPAPGWYIVALAFDVAVVRVVHGACALVYTDPWTGATLLASGITRHAPLRLADLTAERDARHALITLGALLNLGPAATWREVSAAVAEMLDKTPRLTGRWAERALCAEAWAVAAMTRVAALEARDAEACPLCYGSSRYVSDVDCDRCANTGAVLVTP